MSPKLWEKYPLLSTMSKLRASRFNAAERLSRRYRWHSLSLVIFSIYVIALSILPQFFPGIPETTQSLIGFVSIVSSVFVVALSVYSAFSEDVVRGKYLHDNAKRVTNLYQQYKIEATAHDEGRNRKIETSKFEREYATIMDSCPYNHDAIDFKCAMIQIDDIKGGKKFWTQVEQIFDTYFWPILAIILPPLALTAGMLFYPGAI